MARGEQPACKFRGAGFKNETEGVVLPVDHDHRDANNGNGSGNGDAMRQRIDHLEHLVKKLMAERQQGHVSMSASSPSTNVNGACTPTPNPNPAVGLGRAQYPYAVAVASDAQDAPKTAMDVDGGHSVYRSEDDFDALLQEINELKRTWSQGQGQDDQGASHSHFQFRPNISHTVDGTSLLFSQVKPIERVEMLSTLPPKPEVDRLVAQFFDRDTFPLSIPPILHQPTFMHEYNEHWKDPSRTNLIWLGLLFSILGITMLAYHQHGEARGYEGLSEWLFQLYRTRTAQCLLSGDMAKCLPYTVETLRFNATAELNRKDDNRRGLWIMTGVVVRAAINMGYHRDPDTSPSPSPGVSFSVLQAEYRRRIWLSVVSMDDMASFLAGCPRTMSAVASDTKEPRNLYDWELSEESTVLPPSRPLTQPTPTTYLIVKARLFQALGRVADFSSSPTLASYETVLEIDRALHDAYQSIPPHMRVAQAPGEDEHGHEGGDHDNSAAGQPKAKVKATFSNLSLLGMYHKGMCTLHRQFLARARVDARFRVSRQRCLSSALGMLALQTALEPAFYAICHTRQILTLAAMILLLELELRRKAPELDADADADASSPESRLLLQTLEHSCACWAEIVSAGAGDEAARVHHFLVGMLSGFQTRGKPPRSGSSDTNTNTGSSNGLHPNTDTPSSQTVSAATATPAEMEISASSPKFWFDAPYGSGGFSFETELSSMDLDFDWATWDAFMEEAGDETGPIY
ncbi:hypothetical protein A1O3_04173 [Capronia epimyces CBS 606.96]|uniref:Xylanolytic transcriptional activator regulatory domain-containing protein n=1 Tax=Capronia epimyces CBS 606.96 TaxID=1182542 RepID=W9YY36_9EURO|nr:uncharacterized protein A1O3_04173 [Capronia epimyces CBS 606.96]EXJ87214.1 hypothetical protein A1O3_04173 [Capronia epimyces CBS 606.96]